MMKRHSLLVFVVPILFSGAYCDLISPESSSNFSGCFLSNDLLVSITQMLAEGQKFFSYMEKPCDEIYMLATVDSTKISSCEGLSRLEGLIQRIPGILQRLSDLIILNRTDHILTRSTFEDDFNLMRNGMETLLQKTPLALQDQSNLLSKQLDCYTSLVQGRLTSIKSLEMAYENQLVSLISALIEPAQYAKAQVLFYQQNDNSLIPLIMRSLYSERNEYYDGPAAFTQIMQTMHQRIMAYNEWFELLMENKELLNDGIIIITKMVTDDLYRVKLTGEDTRVLLELRELKEKLDVYKNAVLVRWSIQIAEGNFDELISFVSPGKLHWVGHIFHDLMKDIIDKAIDRGNFVTALDFVAKLRWNVQRHTGLEYLEGLANPDQKLVVSLRIKEAMESLNGPDPTLEVEKKFEKLFEGLSGNVQKLVSSPRCYIKNKDKIEYLYCDTNSNKCFTDTVKKCGSLFSFSYIIDPDNGVFKFRILQEDSRYYLEDGGVKDNLRRHARIEQAVPGYNWKIRLGEGDFVLIQHVRASSQTSVLANEFLPSSPKDVHLFDAEKFEPPYNTWALECPAD